MDKCVVCAGQARANRRRPFSSFEKGREKAYLEKLDEVRYLVHGGKSDGMELTFELDEKGVARQFDLETETFPRYVEDKRPINETEKLTGT